MKNIKTDWSKAKVDAMARARGPVKGIVTVLVSSKLGDDYATVMAGKDADAILSTLPPSVGIYAALPSCGPEEIASHMLSLWDDDALKVEPYTVSSDGIVFHKAIPDHLLCDIRTFAWELFAEQNMVEIVEAWGTSAATAYRKTDYDGLSSLHRVGRTEFLSEQQAILRTDQ